MLAAHSKLGASSYSRWGKSVGGCPGSVRLSETVAKLPPSIYAAEGTKAHEVALAVLLKQAHETVSEEMMEAVGVYVDFIRQLRRNEPDFEAVEQKFNLQHYYKGLFGTADYVAYFARFKTLYVVDYKHGAGVAVEVKNSEQLMYYGLGALHENKFPIEKIVLVIVQPRCNHVDGPVRQWEATPLEMIDYSSDLIADAIATEDPNAALVTGEHCRWCPAQAVCPALHSKAIETAKNVFDDPAVYDPERLSATLRSLEQIEAWAKSVRSFAYNEAEAGRIPPGFKLVEKRASRKWVEGVTGKTLSATFTKSFSNLFYTEPELKSIPQIEKIIAKDEKPLLDELTLWISSGKNLVEDNEKNAKRREIAPKAAAVFQDIETIDSLL